MPLGAFTEDIDLIQVLLVAFFLFFALLIIYLRREDKREGYPLRSGEGRPYPIVGWPAPPPPKQFLLDIGGSTKAPQDDPEPSLPVSRNSAPLAPDAAPLPASSDAEVRNRLNTTPMRAMSGELLLAPLRNATEWSVVRQDTDPRGMRVIGSGAAALGTVFDLWVDRAVKILRYLEVTTAQGGHVLLPIFHADINERRREIRVKGISPQQFARVPRLTDPDILTPRDEDRINSFFADCALQPDLSDEATHGSR
jgi:photosynthetic reaction center H subunit